MDDITRRVFFQHISVLGTTLLILPGCMEQEVFQEDLRCTDVANVNYNMRSTLQYTDQSTEKNKNCANCALYTAPESGSDCGGCLTITGPIHPEGYCTIWAAQTA